MEKLEEEAEEKEQEEAEETGSPLTQKPRVLDR